MLFANVIDVKLNIKWTYLHHLFGIEHPSLYFSLYTLRLVDLRGASLPPKNGKHIPSQYILYKTLFGTTVAA